MTSRPQASPGFGAVTPSVACAERGTATPQASAETASLDSLVRIRQDLVPQALDQLAAVTEATERAANDIMGACDQLFSLVQRSGEPGPPPVGSYLTGIFEACAFQDLTGQRIAQVCEILKLIDRELGRATSRPWLSTETAEIAAAATNGANEPPLGGPLAGPQRAEDALAQSDADWLFSLLL
jgi:chemotaxis protein CheZ